MDEKVAIGPVEIKSEELGQVSAVIATLSVIDKDNDYTFPGAFETGAQVDVSLYGHSLYAGGLPVGEGRLRETQTEAIVDAQFYMDTTPGRDAFALVKARGPKLEWSYGYSVLNPPEVVTVGGRKANALRRVRVDEVSPVWRGAGIGTRTLVAKTADDPARAIALRELVRFTKMRLADLRAKQAELEQLEVERIRGEVDAADVAAIRARWWWL